MVGDPALRAEMLAMMEADQAERRGEPWELWHDRERAARLAEILDAAGGWPDPGQVGSDGVFVAWPIAQHADHDVAFQQWARLVADGGGRGLGAWCGCARSTPSCSGPDGTRCGLAR